MFPYRARVRTARRQPFPIAINNLAAACRNKDVIRLLEPAQGRFVKAFGRDHQTSLIAHYNLATAYLDVGRIGAAIPLLERILASAQRDSVANRALIPRSKAAGRL